MSLEDVAKQGKHLQTLIALRDYLATALDNSRSGRDQAALALRLQEVLSEIQEIESRSTDSEFSRLVSGFEW